MLSINTNLAGLIAQNSMKTSTDKLNQAIERMTTGLKINHASDNAANYSISTNMTTQLNAYDVAADNVAMGMDLVTTASDTISLMQNKAERLRALCTQARNGTYGAQSLAAINTEANAIVMEINRIYSTAQYNGVSLFTAGTTSAQATPEVVTFGMTRSATTESYFIADPITYTHEEVEAMTTMTQAVAEGSLVSGGTYSISSVDELVALADYVNSGNSASGMTFVLGDNIDLSSISNWTPIGDYSTSTSYYFRGTFDGNGYVIKNLAIDNETTKYQGLFGSANGAKIKNLGIENVIVKGGSRTAGLVAYQKYGRIENCYIDGEVSGAGYVGGLVGQSSEGTIIKCYSSAKVNSTETDAGGLVGSADETSVKNSYSTGEVIGTGYVGGLIGYLCDTIDSCYATGAVIGTSKVGGLIGYNDDTIKNSYATGTVTGTSNVGALAGYNGDSVFNSYATGAVTGSSGADSVNNSVDWDGTVFTYAFANVLSNVKKENSTISNDISNLTNFIFQVGIKSDRSCQIAFDVNLFFDISAIGVDISSDSALASIDNFINQLSEQETKLGAVQNRLESALESISVNIENLTSSRSTIRDADIAEVSSHYIQQQILQQASATLMATANQSPAIALQLI